MLRIYKLLDSDFSYGEHLAKIDAYHMPHTINTIYYKNGNFGSSFDDIVLHALAQFHTG